MLHVVVRLRWSLSPILVTDVDETYPGQLGVGSASVDWFSREITEADKEQWAIEDAARDARRIPIGFRAPSPVPQPHGRAGAPAVSSPRAPRRSRTT